MDERSARGRGWRSVRIGGWRETGRHIIAASLHSKVTAESQQGHDKAITIRHIHDVSKYMGKGLELRTITNTFVITNPINLQTTWQEYLKSSTRQPKM